MSVPNLVWSALDLGFSQSFSALSPVIVTRVEIIHLYLQDVRRLCCTALHSRPPALVPFLRGTEPFLQQFLQQQNVVHAIKMSINSVLMG